MTGSKKKILFVSCDAGHSAGGSETLWIRTAQKLLETGHAVSVYGRNSPEAATTYRPLISSGAEVYLYADFAESLVRKILARVAEKRHKFRPLSSGPYDLVVVNHSLGSRGLEWLAECARQQLPFISVCQIVHANDWFSDDVADSLITAFAKARRNCFVSRGNLQLLEKRLAHAIASAEIIANPAGFDCPAPLPWPEESDVYRLACVGRLLPIDKGQDLILEALSLPKWKNRAISVSFFGAGNYLKILTRMRDCLGLQHSVQFCGHVTDMAQVWRNHHCLLQPSRSEGFSLALVEAMLCARPVIVSPVGDNSEIIEDGVNGCIMGDLSLTALDQALERAWAGRADWSAWGHRARETIDKYRRGNSVNVFAGKILEWAGC